MRQLGAGPRGCAAGDRRRSTARWLSLAITASDSEKRWLWPPPHAHGLRSSARSPGVVLRVSTTRAPRARDRRDVTRGQRRDAAHALDEVERDPLGLQHRAGRALDGREHVAGLERGRRRPSEVTLTASSSAIIATSNTSAPAKHARLPRDEVCGRDGRRGDEGLST